MSVLMDLYSRRIVGWEYQESMTDALVLASLRRVQSRHSMGNRETRVFLRRWPI